MTTPSAESLDLARMARQHFLQSLCLAIPHLDKLILEQLNKVAGAGLDRRNWQASQLNSAPETWRGVYLQRRNPWAQELVKRWRQAFSGTVKEPQSAHPLHDIDELQLIDDQVIENLIASSRLTTKIADKLSEPFTQLRKRLRGLEWRDLPDNDTTRPSVLVDDLLSSWVVAGMDKEAFIWAIDGVLDAWVHLLQDAYGKANAFLAEKGATPEAGDAVQKQMRQRSTFAPSESSAYLSTATDAMVAVPYPSGYRSHAYPSQGEGGYVRAAGPSGYGHVVSTPAAPSAVYPHGQPGSPVAMAGGGAPILAVPAASFGQKALTQFQAVINDVRQRLAHVIPLAALPPVSSGDGAVAVTSSQAALQVVSPQLQHVLVQQSGFFRQSLQAQELADLARQQSEAIKGNAGGANEKAIIEMVALMFQSVLAEDRVPPSVRVLFARLQVPALRIALADPQFFQDMNHPVRKLIDRMGSSVMGFDGAAFEGSALENELRRIVHMIEQYPDTGAKVFQLALTEFEKFLQKYLSDNRMASKVTSVAQQIEEKETLLVKFTIELRKMLQDLSIKEEVRDFLFRNWAEVLAVSALHTGAKSPATIRFKRTASLLVWISGAKTTAIERSRAAQALPKLLKQVQQGLHLVGVDPAVQEATLAQLVVLVNDAFLSNTQSLSDSSLKALSRKLENVEDLVNDEGLEQLEFSAHTIELMLGVDASNLTVLTQPGEQAVPAEVLDWAKSREVGAWFKFTEQAAKNEVSLADTHVQYLWHSQQKMLHLFASNEGQCYLLTLQTLAAYFQNGKLLPLDQEGLMLRATREALTQYHNLPPVSMAD